MKITWNITLAVPTEPDPDPVQVFSAFDQSGGTLTEVDVPELRVSVDGGTTYDTLTNLGLTLTVDNGDLLVGGFSSATTTKPEVEYEQSGSEPYDALDNSELSAIFTLAQGDQAPVNAFLPGFALTPTKLGEPV